jgi:hypothetical protein
VLAGAGFLKIFHSIQAGLSSFKDLKFALSCTGTGTVRILFLSFSSCQKTFCKTAQFFIFSQSYLFILCIKNFIKNGLFVKTERKVVMRLVI